MKTGKKALIALGVAAVLVAAVLFLLFSSLERIVAAAIEKYGSEATGTKVRVASVRLDLKGGKGSVLDLRVGNPAGFETPDAIRFGDISVEVDARSVASDPAVIERVTILSPRISYEIDGEGRSNFDLLRKRLAGEPARGTAGRKAADKAERKVVIRRLVIEKGEIAIRVAALSGKPLSASLPRIELSNLGGKGGGSPGEIARQVLGPIASKATAAAAGSGIGRFLGKGKEAAKEAEDSLRKMIGK